MIKIKICGCKSENDIRIVNKYLPDYVGFVFAKSRRKVTEEIAEGLKQMLLPQIQAVGVFVNAPISQVIRLCEKGVIDLVQLHGEETKEYIEELKESITVPMIKAIRIPPMEQTLIQQLKEAQKLPCDYLLLDTYQKDRYGGSGIAFDWSMIPYIKKPFFLAGGIKQDNIIRAVNETRAYCLDISSGVERNGGKDEELVKQILKYRNRTKFVNNKIERKR